MRFIFVKKTFFVNDGVIEKKRRTTNHFFERLKKGLFKNDERTYLISSLS